MVECRILCRFPLLSLARAQEPEDPEKAVGTQPGARERAPNEPPHPSQGRSQCTLLSLPRPLQRRSYLYPRPRDSGLQLLGSRSLSPIPWDPRVPPSCISWSPSPGPSRLPLRVHILSLINVHSVFPPVLSVCCRLWAPEDWAGD